LAAHLHPSAGEQPDRGGRQGDAARINLTAAAAERRAADVSAARIRALYRSHHSRRFFLGSSTLGALLVVLITFILGSENLPRAAIWLSLVAAADVGLTMLDRRFQVAGPTDDELGWWGWARAALAGARGLAWSLGPILMYVQGDTVSLVVPTWGLINLMAASAYTAAPFFPCLLAIALCGVLPAASWMILLGSDTARLSALLLTLALPFIAFIGMLGRRNIGALIASRLDLAEILDQQKQQTKIVEDALAERTRFFSAASHDLRQPLQALGFYTSLLATKGGDDSYREIVGRLAECASSLDRQFNAILGIAQTDSAVRRARVVPTPLQRTLERVEVSVRPEAELKRLKIRIVPTKLWVAVAPDLLERVLANLAINAVRYTPAGGILIGVRHRGTSAEIWVVDTGIGIAEQHRQNIFEEFYQIDNPARDREHGFGLGLATVRRLCVGMHWPLDFTSRLDKGSCFKVAVPIAAPAPEQPAPEGIPPPALTAATSVGVVVIDDDPLVRDAMQRMITSWGLHVETCRTGDQAMATLQARDSTIRWQALIDYRLSGGENGLDVADRIVNAFGRGIALALMTAETDSAIFEQAARREIVVLRKPVKPIRLRAILTAPTPEPLAKHEAESEPDELRPPSSAPVGRSH
jgi:two-component system, sensor histidine kinase